MDCNIVVINIFLALPPKKKGALMHNVTPQDPTHHICNNRSLHNEYMYWNIETLSN